MTGEVREADEGGAEPNPGDGWMLLVTLALAGAGLVMVLSASQALAYLEHHSSFYFLERQALFVGAGLIALLVLARIDHHEWRAYAPYAAAAAGLLMVIVLVPGVGVLANGARRWINLGPLGAFQPSELGKLAFAVFLAGWLDRRGERLRSFSDGLLPFALMLGAVLLVLMLQKDVGTALVTTAILGSMFFAAGGRAWHVLLLLAGLALAFVLLTSVESYRASRLSAFLDPFKDPLGAGFQSTQGLIALGSGGLTGVGLGHSVQKFAWLPEAHSDFIFAIVGEETGLIGATLLLAAFVFLGVRGYRAAMRAPDGFGLTLGVGLTTWITFQALLNMGTVTDTLPITGVPLPFISYGGSSAATTLAAVGILLNIAGQGSRQTYRRSHATVDIGRGDRRPPVPGSRRRAGVQR